MVECHIQRHAHLSDCPLVQCHRHPQQGGLHLWSWHHLLVSGHQFPVRLFARLLHSAARIQL
ncbi:NnrU family protein [uncultured Prevotellamassilia sp.]|uniref:NnrU family protein n=1 Tax=uncultured Prevotellamassilia sp. TaxID=1926676 RepID=UPI00338FC475